MRIVMKISDWQGQMQTRTFWSPDEGGYVWEESPGRCCQLGQQVCEGLSFQGDTLTSGPGVESLKAVLRLNRRRERAAWRAEKRRDDW